MDKLKVRKKDGSLEEWIPDKIITSMVKAGLDPTRAEEIANSIESFFLENSQEKVVSSEEIKNKVIEELDKVDSLASESYRVYKKS